MTNNESKHTSTVQPRKLTDNIIATHKAPSKDRWAADLAFDESERAELLRLLPRYDHAADRPTPLLRLPSRNALATLVTRAVALIRTRLPRPAAAGPKRLGAGAGHQAFRRAASLLRAAFGPCSDNAGPAAGEGRAAGRLATGTRTLLRTRRRSDDAGR
jgi:hypothetical protein